MSDGAYRLVFKPLSGEFSLEKVQLAGGGDGTSGTVAAGTLSFPNGTSFLISNGIAVNNGAELVLAPGAEIVVT